VSFYLHPHGLCESSLIGDGTRIWAFAHVLPGARIGRDCNICDHVFIENDVVVGDRVTVKCGVQLWDGLIVEDDVFIGPNATFSNDRFPRSRQYPESFARTVIQRGASIGAGATILPGITIGRNAMVGAGSVVISDVQPDAVVMGNPAHVVRYLDTLQDPSGMADSAVLHEARSLSVPGVMVQPLKRIDDSRGNLVVGEFFPDVPFVPKRFFMIFDVPSNRIRAGHALKTCNQFIVCTKGQCSLVVSNGKIRQEVRLDEPGIGVYIPAMTWLTMYKFSADAVLTVFASTIYDPGDYIRDYQEYVILAGG
jgi:UDP-2-acetamido-3-amino-2,3-dideoxy-glucuronate N-acetyltransferase